MRVLVIAAELPAPPNQGGRMRMLAVLQSLVAAGHEVDLIAVTLKTPRQEELAVLTPLCRRILLAPRPQSNLRTIARILRSWATLRPYVVLKHMSGGLSRLVRTQVAAARPDVAVLEFHYVADTVAALDGVPAIVDMHNIDSELYDRFASQKTWNAKKIHALVQRHLVRRFEARLPTRFRTCVTVSDRDQRTLADLSRASNIAVAPNGFDPVTLDRPIARIRRSDVVFVGSMDFFPNVDAARFLVQEVMPHVWQSRPNATVTIVGHSPTKAVCDLASDTRVAVTGRVDDVREYVAGASVIAIPLRMGSGTRLKAIEAAALGLPIVGTSIGLEGLGFVDGKHALVRDNPAGLASAVLAVLESPDLGIRVGTEAREHVRSRFNWLTCLKPLLHALEQAPVQVKV